MSAALGDMRRAAKPAEVLFAEKAAEKWGLHIKSAIHFIHVDDIGSYTYSKKEDFDDYGFVLADLIDGAPVQVQSHRISGTVGDAKILKVV